VANGLSIPDSPAWIDLDVSDSQLVRLVTVSWTSFKEVFRGYRCPSVLCSMSCNPASRRWTRVN
jgi:hypothetical protein